MIDGHIHIEKQPYSVDTINKMVQVAIEKGIDEIHVLEHTHKFLEFKEIYDDLSGDITINWYKKKKPISLKLYLDFISEMKKVNFPIKVLFGLEVCYNKSWEEKIRSILENYHFDFLIGSVHFIDGYGFDLCQEIWNEFDIDLVYKTYFWEEECLIKSRMFRTIGHPDLIKKYEIYPSFDLSFYYEKIAILLAKNNVIADNNSKLFQNGFPYCGMHPYFIDALRKNNCIIEKSSDAHTYDKIGSCFEYLEI